MKKRIIYSCFIMLSVMFVLTGCISAEEREQAEAWRKQAEKNAVNYIEEKYGFKAEVIDSETQKAEDLFVARYTSKTLVTMEYAGKEFRVLSFGEDEHMDKATDNYQKDEILEDYIEALTALFGVQPDSIDVCGGDNSNATIINGEEFYDMFYREYYDGANLEDVLMQDAFYCVAEYVGDFDLENLYEKNKTPLFEHKNMHAAFVAYDSRENMQLCNIDAQNTYEQKVYENALYVKNALVNHRGEITPIKMSIGQCEDFYYLNVDADISQYCITKDAEICDADEWNGHGFKNATFVSDNAYYMEGHPKSKLYIYIPQEKYEQLSFDEEDVNVVVVSKSVSQKNGNESYNIWFRTREIPGYQVFYTYNAHADDFSFRFMYNAK